MATTAESVTATTTSDLSELLSGARQDQDWAWRDLCALYLPRLERYASMQGADDPAGIANITLLEFHRSIDKFRGNDRRALDAYLYRTARNRIVDEHRKSPGSTVPLVTGELTPSIAAAADFDEVIAGEEWVSGLLANLTEDQRKVLELRFMQDRSVNETAAILDKAPGTVNVIQHRALKALRIALAAAAIAAAWFGVRQLADGADRSISVEPADTSLPGQPLVGELDGPNGSTPNDPEGSGAILDGPSSQFDQDSSAESNDGEALAETQSSAETQTATETQTSTETQTAAEAQASAETAAAETSTSAQPATAPQTQPPTTQAPAAGPPTSPIPPTTQPVTTRPPTTQPVTTKPPTTQPVTTEAPVTQPPPTQPVTTAEPIVVDTPDYCEVQMASSGVATTGVEVHDLEQDFAERYVFYDENRNVVWSGTDPQQVEGVEIEFESIPSGFDPELVYYVAAQEGDSISQLRSCLRRA